MKLSEIYKIAVPEKKRKEERYNFWVAWVLRPASIIITALFINKKIKPITITKFSVLFLLIGSALVSFGNGMVVRLVGWLFFFLWAIFDCVDGNLARCNKMMSSLGDLWDTMGGYMAMALTYFAVSIAAFYDNNLVTLFENYWYLILGGFSAIMSIFPRIILQKKKASLGKSEAVNELADKESFNFSKIVALNVISPTGFLQMVFLLCIVFHLLNIFTIVYFVVNLFVMLLSLRKLLR